MELVPIIVSALKIVAALAAVAIIFSYIIYKIKLKKGISEPPEKRIAQTVVYTEKSVKRIVERITKHVPPPQPPQLVKPEIEKKVKLDPSTKKPVKSIEEHKPKQRPKAQNSDRLEVVKSLKPNSTKEEPVEKKPEKPSNLSKNSVEEKNMASLGDKILDKYAEDDSGEMYTLNTKKDSNKKK